VLGIDLWEKAWHTPAENAGVIAVGALAYNSQVRASFSNFGTDQLDIYAPGVIELGPDPSNSGNIAQIVSGTSFASPFAAGVAALIWAANPSLSANAVESILYSTAVKRPHVSVHQYVNALDAVLAAVGNVPPYVDITSPAAGSQYSRRAEPVPLAAYVEDYEDNFVHVAWTSNRDGLITQSNVVSGVTALASPSDLSYGDHIITATVTDSAGQVRTDSINVTIVNDPPTMTILSPTTSGPFFVGQSIQLLAQSSDANEASLKLADSAVAWSSSLDGFLGTGHSLLTTLSAGVHAITVTGTDPLGATGTASIGIEVVVPTSGFPTATILSPASTDGSATVFLQGFDESAGRWYADVEFVGQATDPEDGPLSGGALVWTTNRGDLQTTLLGTGETLTVRLYADDQFGGTHLIALVATDSDLQPSAPYHLVDPTVWTGIEPVSR
jgi:serine protease